MTADLCVEPTCLVHQTRAESQVFLDRQIIPQSEVESTPSSGIIGHPRLSWSSGSIFFAPE
jgi:hypothetical protein